MDNFFTQIFFYKSVCFSCLFLLYKTAFFLVKYTVLVVLPVVSFLQFCRFFFFFLVRCLVFKKRYLCNPS